MKSRITKVLFISLLFSAKIFPAAEMDEAEYPPLIIAIFENKALEKIKLLVENNANVNEKCILCDISALIAATKKDRPDLVKFLLEKNANVNEKDSKDHSALCFAKNRKIQEILEENGAETTACSFEPYFK